MDQFRTAITGLTAQIDNATASASKAQQSAQSASQTLQDVKASADRAYMFGMIGVGVGVAGIVIAVIALSRREKVEGEKISRF
jgi:phosphotransferase system  glucose/maltose/N-acetylglucosamine-specific IIC component